MLVGNEKDSDSLAEICSTATEIVRGITSTTKEIKCLFRRSKSEAVSHLKYTWNNRTSANVVLICNCLGKINEER